jgi:drug/metabolite transporter (DMT)-like permease
MFEVIGMDQRSENIRGALLMSACMAGFVLNDAMVKTVSGHLNLYQVMFLRGIFASLFIGLLAWRQKALFVRLSWPDWKVLILRTVGEVGGTLCFLTALFNMPIANATAILQALPLVITVGAALFLGHTVGWRRYLAVLIGFSGVLIIVRPGADGFTEYAYWAIVSVLFITLRDLVTSKLSARAPSLFIALVAALSIMTVGAVMSQALPWQPVRQSDLLYLAAAALFLMFGYLFAIMAMRVGEIAFISPFRYTVLLWAILLGIVLFDEIPDSWTMVGSTIVIAMGLYTFHRERRSRKAASTVTASSATNFEEK